MHEHSYIGCEHELKHCKHCDVVYCNKCSHEWATKAADFIRDYFKPSPYKSNPPPYLSPQWSKPDVILCNHRG